MIKHFTASGAQTVAAQGGLRKLLIQVNAALTGTITLTDGVGTQAIITNPTVGSVFQYWDLVGQVQVNPSATCDISCSGDTNRGAK